MLNIQNLLGQLASSNNPMQMLMGLLSPNQKSLVNNFKSQPSEKQAAEIARICNEKGISKSDLASIINSLKGGK